MFPKNTLFLVTGVAGFIGSNLAERLLTMGYRVRGLDNFLTGYRENIATFIDNPLFEFIEGDIRDIQTCQRACERVDYVLHQAALSSVKQSIVDPSLYVDVNINGTLRMMSAAMAADVKRFVYASSASVYGDSTLLPAVEGDEGFPLSPYAVTKRSNELYAQCYWLLHGLATIGLRYFNVFGPRQDPRSEYAAVIPRFITGLLTDQPVIIYGDGEQSRDFTHVENVVLANLLACHASVEANGQVFNIACGEATTLNKLLSELCALLGSSRMPVYTAMRPGDVRHSLANVDKASRYLGYSPSLSLRDGIHQTLSCYHALIIGTDDSASRSEA